MVDAAAVRAAIKARATHVLDNKDTLSLKGLRKLLEEDMGLAEGALKEHKAVLEATVSALILAGSVDALDEPAADVPAEDEGDRDDDGSNDDDGAPSGPSDGSEDKDSRKEKKEKEAKKKKAAPAPAKAAPRHVSAAIARLKAVAKAATVTVPPSLYVKHKGDAELQAALEDLLAGHGLSAASEPADTARIKRKLVAARELDGIDTSNIVQGGRGSRRAAPSDFSAMLKAPRLPGDSDSDASSLGEPDDDDDDDDDTGTESSGDSDAKPRKRRPAKASAKAMPAKKKAKAEVEELSVSDDEDDNDEEEGDESDGGEVGGGNTGDAPPPAKETDKGADGGKVGGVKAWSDDDD